VNKANVGASLESFLRETGELEEVRLLARKKVVADLIAQAMKRRSVSVAEMSRRMRTSRAAVARILNPEQTGLTLDSLDRAAHVLGYTVEISLRQLRNENKTLDTSGPVSRVIKGRRHDARAKASKELAKRIAR
jgi:antitoxin HicB